MLMVDMSVNVLVDTSTLKVVVMMKMSAKHILVEIMETAPTYLEHFTAGSD